MNFINIKIILKIKSGEKEILKYIGQYYIFHETNTDGKKSKNKDDNYLKSKNNQIYRYSDKTLAILLPSGSSSVNNLLPKFEAEGIKVWNIISPDVCEEAILGFAEEDIHKVHNIMKFMKMGSKDQLKEKLERDRRKEERDKEKLKLKEES